VAACATTGIAAELLFEGTTVHRRFGPIPQDLSSESDSLIDLESEKANVIRAADVIIIDEVSGMHKVNKIKFYNNYLVIVRIYWIIWIDRCKQFVVIMFLLVERFKYFV
jgi:hypothetical protein